MRKHLPLIVIAVVAALLVMPATYALLRGYDVLFTREANPATVIFSPKIAMFWRLWVAAYLAPMVGVGVFFAARRDQERTLKVLYICALVAAGMITFQGVFLP